MAGDGVNIDLDEVQAAAKTIAALLEEMQGPFAQLEAHINMVEDSVYGTDLLGKSLTGGGSSVGGFNKHQKDVLAGIKLLLSNATAMGTNLQTMAARHQANDEEHASALSRISAGDGTPLAPLTPAVAPSPTPTPMPAPTPAPAPAPVPPPDNGGYHTQDGPSLDYNKPKPPPEPHGPVGGGRNLI
ncbi:WXG100 family type VII secretion target [Kitasatospora sp. NPDC051984]|uniref:WXG100 family type VII secretion target n=1 Tax=Kitasatospora sp. NPDC051984 TaxID=3364059 RepID=UPI0037C67BCE